MSISEKLITVAENVPEVYESGKSSMVDESKLLPTTVSGNYISLDDVSEIPHKVSCKISGVNNLEGVKVMRTGKNIINIDTMLGSCLKKNADGTYTLTKISDGSRTSQLFNFIPSIPAGTSFTISANIIKDTTLKGLSLWFTYDDGAYGYWELKPHNYSLTLSVSKNISSLRLYLHTETEDGTSTIFSNFQLEFDDKSTEYEPYTAQIFTPTTDGTIEGMTSASPHMNISTDTEGVNIEATYNKSWGIQEASNRFCNVLSQGVICHSIYFKQLTLSKENMLSIINALSPTVTGQAVTFKKSTKEAAFTDAEWAALIATKPNWTFSLI